MSYFRSILNDLPNRRLTGVQVLIRHPFDGLEMLRLAPGRQPRSGICFTAGAGER